MKAWILVATLVVAACSGANEGRPHVDTHDFSPVHAAIDRFVKSGRTPQAFAQLTSGIEEMRGRDAVVAVDAELRLLALAAPLIERARSRPLATELDELALTVWPTLLSSPLTGERDPTFAPSAGESPRSYVARLCQSELAAECAAVPADVQAITVRAIALRNANERMRIALAQCLHCTADGPEWQRLGWTLESLDNEASHQRTRIARAERAVVSQAN